jgi:DNA end-binding protein Ku
LEPDAIGAAAGRRWRTICRNKGGRPALKELLRKKQSGQKIEVQSERAPAKVINLMDALRRSVDAERGGGGEGERRAAASRRTPKKAARSNSRKSTG